MSFKQVLERLRDAALIRQRGMSPDKATVRTSDLREFVQDWELMDAKLRAQHHNSQYPISHGSHIIQYHDETFVWYDEAGLQGGVEYSLEQAQATLKRYAEAMNEPAPVNSPSLAEQMVMQILAVAPENYAGHTFGVTKADGTVLGDVTVTVVKPGGKAPHDLVEELSTAVASALANSAKGPVGEVRISQQDYDTLRSLLPRTTCKHCGWPHINTTETCDDATARERGKV